MINLHMRYYPYYTFGTLDEYGQETLSKEFQGTIKMAIELTSQSVQDNINYSGANYIGLTKHNVTDSYVIKYGEEELKVLYINPKGRYKQVYMAKI